MSSLPSYNIHKIVFSIFSPHEIREMSAVEVTNPDTYDEDGVPIPGGVMDPRFGSQEPYQSCPVCGNTGSFCPGHFGNIELAEPVLHTVFINEIKMILQSVCPLCGRVKYPAEKREAALESIKRLQKTQRKELDQLYRSILRRASKRKDCPFCGASAMKIDFQKPYVFSTIDEQGRAVRLYTSEIREIFERIPDEDLPLTGFDPTKARPEWLILEVLPIPPLSVRPSTQLEAGMRSEDDLTHKLVDIVKVNQKVKESKEAGSPAIIVRDTVDLLQYHVATYFDNNITGVPPARHRSGRQLRTIAQRLSGKDGRFRSNLVGKRVDFSARTVISPDSNLQINEVGVPLEIASKLTIPERITEINLDRMKELVTRGPNAHPGANYLIRPDGRRIYLEYVPDREALADALEPGYLVERHLQNGDIVLFNRQPSLHRMSIMAHFVKVLPYRTFRLHLSVCPPYNADFDGDEMNLHVLQNEEATAEAKMLMRVQKQIISPRYGAPIIGCHRDNITSAYLLTSDETYLPRKEFFDLAAAIDYEGDLPNPAKKRPVPLYTGKQVFSLLLPKDFTYSLRATSGGRVVIKEGQLVEGVIDEASIGAERADSVLHRIAREYGYDFAGAFITKVSRLLDRFLTIRGFSIGAEDLIVPDEVYDKLSSVLTSAKKRVSKAIDKYRGGALEAIRGLSIQESLELKVMDILSKARDTAGKTALRNLATDNPLSVMTISGARGSSLNVAQLSAVLGQQSIRGERIKRGFDGRTLTVFEPGDMGASAEGFVFNSFMSGLTPTEFFFHAMGGREGLVDTAVRTQQSGYLQRRLINSLEHLVVAHDSSVRTTDGAIVQFNYGDDGVDPARSDHGKPVNVERLIDSVSLLHPKGKGATKDFMQGIIDKVETEIPAILAKELTKQLAKKNATKAVVKEVIRQAVVSYKTSKVDPGSAIGVIAAQSLGEPGTQMTLRTFHYAGVKERDVTLGLPRIIEIVDARKKPSTPFMTIYLRKKYRKDQEAAESLANRIVSTIFQDLVVESFLDLVHGEIVFRLSREAMEKRGLDGKYLLETVLKKQSGILEGDELRVQEAKGTVDELRKLREKLLAKHVSGVKFITQITVNYENGEWVLYTQGSKLGPVLAIPEVDARRTTTNDVTQIAAVLGIEAARNAIVEELENVLDEQGLDVDIRHLMLIADLMTRTGVVKGGTRYGIVKEKESVLARAAFEITVPILRTAAVRGEEDYLRGVTENLIIGARVPIGTGLVDVFMRSGT
ncbi:MAG: DNA-directed RNA polymerase subunit A' [Candidatus Geothermarchaeales archaeon]